MKKVKLLFVITLLIAVFSATVYSDSLKPVELSKINDQIWVHTSYQLFNGSPLDSNGLVIITQKGLVLIDTCWDNRLTKELLTISEAQFKQQFVLAIITHAHADRIGGIEALLEKGIKVISTKLTAQEAIKDGFKQPLPELLDSRTELEIGNVKIEAYYPGEAHTKDNIVVWLPTSKVLFAGCIVKGLEWKNIGNITDGNIKEYPKTLNNLLTNYPVVSVVIPGHGKPGDVNLIYHTLKLCK